MSLGPGPQRVLDAVRVFHAHPELDDGELVEALRRAGFGETEAELAVAFIPLAFGRVVLRQMGVTRLMREFLVEDRNGKRVARPLAAEPWYRAAMEVARSWPAPAPSVTPAEVPTKAEMQAVLQRSGEVAVARDLLAGGGEAADLVLVEPLLMRLSAEMFARERRWWEVWRS